MTKLGIVFLGIVLLAVGVAALTECQVANYLRNAGFPEQCVLLIPTISEIVSKLSLK
jgi:hypothetical protein